MRSKLLLTMMSVGLLFSACKKDEDSKVTDYDTELELTIRGASNGVGLSAFTLPLSNEFADIPQDPRNPINQAKVDLGALLFHETGLGLNPKHAENMEAYSCASCHFASAGFQAGTHQGIADGGLGFGINGEGRVKNPIYADDEMDVQPVRSPSALNIAYQEAVLWNGQFGAVGVNAGTQANWTPGTPIETNELGYHGTETQAIAALTVHRLDMNETICEELNYRSLFDFAFPEVPEENRYDKEHAGLAIAAYERTILAYQSPFQLWLRGNSSAMSDIEKRGAILFFGKAGCADCHSGPNLADMDFHAIGMKDLHEVPEATFNVDASTPAHLGRYSFTKNDADKYKFKTPQLYNLVDSPFFGHGSSFRSVRDVVEYKNAGVKENATVADGQLAEQFKPLGLTDEEITEITAFIEQSLRDPNLLRYQPLSIRSGNCFPNNDIHSRDDLGCD